jgi:hypothetical protein
VSVSLAQVQLLSSGIDFRTEHVQYPLEELIFHKEAELQFHVFRPLVPSKCTKNNVEC